VTLLGALAAVVLLLALLLLIPVDILLQVEKDEGFSGRLSVRWLFGKVGRHYPLPPTGPGKRGAKRLPPAPPPGVRAEAEGKGRKTRRGRALAAALRSPGFPSRCLGLLLSLARRVRLRRLEMLLRGGLDDPAATGRLCGALAAAGALLPGRITFLADWESERLTARAAAGLRVVPLEILLSLGAFAFHPDTLRALRRARREAKR